MPSIDRDGYHSAYRAELYDLGHDSIDWLNEDAAVFLAAYKKMRSARSRGTGSSSRYRILDVGCGTGRVFRQLATNLKKEWVSPEGTQFIGLDLSPDMLSRAAATLPNILGPHTTYVLGSALDLTSIKELEGPPTIDLMTFAAGSISMLYEPADGAERFLEQAAAVLRPETGRAYISVRYVFDDSKSAEAEGMASKFAEMGYVADYASQVFPGIIYRQVEGGGQRREGNLVFWDLPMEVVEKTEDGERVIERDVASMGGRVWKDGELLAAAMAAGLELVETIATSNETMYVFKVAGGDPDANGQ